MTKVFLLRKGTLSSLSACLPSDSGCSLHFIATDYITEVDYLIDALVSAFGDEADQSNGSRKANGAHHSGFGTRGSDVEPLRLRPPSLTTDLHTLGSGDMLDRAQTQVLESLMLSINYGRGPSIDEVEVGSSMHSFEMSPTHSSQKQPAESSDLSETYAHQDHRRLRIEKEQQRRNELREGYARLKHVSTTSKEKSSKVVILDNGANAKVTLSFASLIFLVSLATKHVVQLQKSIQALIKRLDPNSRAVLYLGGLLP